MPGLYASRRGGAPRLRRRRCCRAFAPAVMTHRGPPACMHMAAPSPRLLHPVWRSSERARMRQTAAHDPTIPRAGFRRHGGAAARLRAERSDHPPLAAWRRPGVRQRRGEHAAPRGGPHDDDRRDRARLPHQRPREQRVYPQRRQHVRNPPAATPPPARPAPCMHPPLHTGVATQCHLLSHVYACTSTRDPGREEHLSNTSSAAWPAARCRTQRTCMLPAWRNLRRITR